MREEVLPDYLRSSLRVVICGTSVAKASAQRRHYYAGPGNEFWALLHQGGLSPVRLRPEDDSRVIEWGIGLTDLAKGVAASSDRGLADHFDAEGFLAKMALNAPRVVAFHGKKAAEVVSRYLRHGRSVRLGLQPWRIGDSLAFVLPNASGANRDPNRLEGKATRAEWFKELAALLREPGGGYGGAQAS